jgi:hypothetical protein
MAADHPEFEFHFDGDPAPRLNCTHLVQAIVGQYRPLTLPRADENAGRHGSGGDSGSEEDAPRAGGGSPRAGGAAPLAWAPGNPADLGDASKWVAASHLQWGLASERTITAEGAARTLANLREAGEFDAARRAVCALAAGLAAAYPEIAGEARGTLLQIAALGHEMATALAQTPDLLMWAKSELQPVDLVSLLNVA